MCNVFEVSDEQLTPLLTQLSGNLFIHFDSATQTL